MGESDPYNFIQTNCWGTVNILKTYPNARIINVTSASAKNVMGIYGATKQFSETVGKFHKNCLNVRPHNVFGEGQREDSLAVIPLFIKAKLEGNRPIIYGDGSMRRDFTYVGDVVNYLYSMMFENDLKGVIDVGYGNSLTILELCKEIFGSLPDIQWEPVRPFDCEFSISSNPIPQVFGMKEGIKRTIEWWKASLS